MWSENQLQQVDRDRELRIAAYRGDGTLRRAVLVWAVVHDGAVFVRSWYRKDTGWNAVAARTGRAQVRVAGSPVDVRVDDVGGRDPALRHEVDDAYRRKYGVGVGSMISDPAAATTLRLLPAAPAA